MPSSTIIEVNENGVMICHDGIRRYGIEWKEVYKVSIQWINGITEVKRFIVLDFEYGEYLEFPEDLQGFQDLLKVLPSMLPIDREAFEAVFLTKEHDAAALTIWCRKR